MSSTESDGTSSSLFSLTPKSKTGGGGVGGGSSSSSNRRRKSLETQATWFWLGSLVCLLIASRNFHLLWSPSATVMDSTTREIYENGVSLPTLQSYSNLPTRTALLLPPQQQQQEEVDDTTVVDAMESLSHSTDQTNPAETPRNIHTITTTNNTTQVPQMVVQPSNNNHHNSNSNESSSSRLPQWLEDYFVWHAEQRSQITPENYQDFRYLIMACNGKCGGTTDRLRPLPFMLRLAFQSQRLFFIHWVKPAALEEFLLPPIQDGLDWRIPSWLEEQTRVIPRTGLPQLLQYTQADHVLAVRSHFQSWNYGELYYNEQIIIQQQQQQNENQEMQEPTAQQVFRKLWRRVFTPAPALRQVIQDYYTKIWNPTIQPGQYASAHMRLLYARESRPQHIIKEQTFNAMNCVSTLRPGGPFFVASDSDFAIQVALWYGQQKGVRVVTAASTSTTTNSSSREPIHLDSRIRASPNPSDYYDTFVDIYLIANTNCIAHGKGGFGQWGILMGYNPECSIDHNRQSCNWTDATTTNSTTTSISDNPQLESLFPEPMPPVLESFNNNDTTVKSSTMKESHDMIELDNTTVDQEAITSLSQDSNHIHNVVEEQSTIVAVKQANDTTITTSIQYDNNNNNNGLMLWNQSTVLPNWLKNYFQWHHQQRLLLNESNWESFRFFIITCGHTTPVKKCGGTTDRLRPMPILLKVASTFQRILLIDWHHPAPLEEFLLPPQGGMDWRLPPWLSQKLLLLRGTKNDNSVVTGMKRIRMASSKPHKSIVRVQYQSFNYGEDDYNQWLEETPNGEKEEEEASVYQVFPEIWKILFTPSPPIAHRIVQSFQKLQLIPGQYATAHIRALFARESRPESEIEKATLRAMDCVSQLRPGGPYLVASDSPIAVQKAIQYGQEKGVRVVSAAAAAANLSSSDGGSNEEPIHLDSIVRVSSNPADYYDTFVDIYMIAHTNCVTHGKGGFGQWGALLGYNQSCVSKFHQGGDCTWMNASSSSSSSSEVTTSLTNDSDMNLFNETILRHRLLQPPMIAQDEHI